MKINNQTIGRMIDDYYHTALKDPYIRKPFAWALYHTWQFVDKNEKDRLEELKEANKNIPYVNLNKDNKDD